MIVTIGGQRGVGKTSLLLALLKRFNTRQDVWGGFKPFDTGRSELERAERHSDGERIRRQLRRSNPHITVVSPYHSHENYSVAFSLRREGIIPKKDLVEKNLRYLTDRYEGVLIEAPGGLSHRVFTDTNYGDWLYARTCRTLWICDASRADHTSDIMELNYLKNLDQNAFLLLNCRYPETDQEWLVYLWQNLQQETGFEVIGVLAYDANMSDNRWSQTMTSIETKIITSDKIIQ